jgi:hypothetical protein
MGAYNQGVLTVLLVLASVLVVFLIVVAIKLIGTLTRTNALLDNIEKKVHSVDGVFDVIDKVTDGVSSVSDVVVSGITNAIEKVFSKKEEKEEEE